MSIAEAPLPEGDTAFKVEQHGIDFIPETERWAKPRDLFGMWAGASVQFEYLVYGAVLMTFGFTFKQAVALIIIGNLSYLLLGVCSLQGPLAGTTVFTLSRSSFGTHGSKLTAFFNWLTQVGFETEGLVLIVLAAIALSDKGGHHPGTGMKLGLIFAAAAVQTILPFLGHATVIKVLRALIIPFVVLYIILAALTLGKAKLNGVHHGASWETWMVGLAFVITLSGLGWVENGNDFSRYLPADASKKAIVGWVFLGTAVPEILIMLLGAAVATYVPSAGGSPVTDFPKAFSSWFLVPFLVVAIVQLFAINSLDLYSSGVTLQALGVPIRRWQAVLLDTVIAFGLTIYAVFSSSFTTLLNDFVAVVIVWIAPWMAIFLTDWLLRGRRYDPAELQRTDRGGLYWGQGGIRWSGVVSLVLGMIASSLALSSSFKWGPIFPGWISRQANGADFSVFTGIVVGGLAYLVLAGASVRREASRQGAPAAG